MKGKVLISALVLFFYGELNAQCVVNGSNLIPNPSFENTTGFCDGTDNQIYVDQTPVQNWAGLDTKLNGGSTPDICRSPADASTCGNTTNAANNTCFTGLKRAGYFALAPFANGREYIQIALSSALVAGRTYCLSADLRSRYGAAGNRLLDTDGFGAYFRNGGAVNIQTMNGGNQFVGPGSTLNFVPQLQQLAGTVITNSCYTFTGTFVAAGGENRIILGNFRGDAATTTAGSSSSAYIFIDNLKLYEVPVPLPIELMTFDVKCQSGGTEITWITASERDNDYFQIERSCNGYDFEVIATIDGAGNSSSEKNYVYNDFEPCSGYSYYRLSQTDFNGLKETFYVEAATCGGQNVVVYPNPAGEKITIKNNGMAITDIKLIDETGKLVKNLDGIFIPDKSDLTVDLSDLASGIYILCFIQDREITYYKLSKN